MNRKDFIRNTALVSGLLALPKFRAFAKVLEQAAYQIEMLTPEIGVFTERGGTILFYLGKKGVSIVDSQFPDSVANLIKDLEGKGKTKFEYLINTHHHGDHTSGNIAFKDKVKNVIAHQNSLTNQKANAQKQKNEDKQLFPDLTYDQKLQKKISKEKLAMHYYGAGHTNGDSIVHFTKANIAHVGDLVFNRRFPFVDRSAGANIESWIKVLQQIQTNFNDETKFVCGHAAQGYKIVINKSDINAFENYLSSLLLFVKNEISAGKTKEEILKNKTIPNAPEWKGDGIERSLTAAYEELTAVK
jgi:cyclase